MTMRTEAQLFLKELTVAGAVIENAHGGSLSIVLDTKCVYVLLGDDICYLIGGGQLDDKIPYRHWEIFKRDVKEKLGIG